MKEVSAALFGGGIRMSESMQLVDRVLSILEELCVSKDPLGPTRLSEKLGLSKSTVYRLLNALTSRGYAEKTDDGTYRLGCRLLELMGTHINSLELIAEARPYLSSITADLNLTAHLGILDRDEVIYIEKLDAVPTGYLSQQIGFRVPAFCSSLGKCLLAGLSGQELTEALERCRFSAYTKNTIPNRQELSRHLRQVRMQGWAMDNCEYAEDRRCVAAPIYDYRGDVIAAISASGTIVRLPDDRIPKVVITVKQAAECISQRLGYFGQ